MATGGDYGIRGDEIEDVTGTGLDWNEMEARKTRL